MSAPLFRVKTEDGYVLVVHERSALADSANGWRDWQHAWPGETFTYGGDTYTFVDRCGAPS